ncbi:MAG: respiratory nitrate reductase subunit gamma [Deltaproteobacteria bacterium]|nr:respiratory nitrate reductase subunit gamma [Deltaproteobacteria bacterium]
MFPYVAGIVFLVGVTYRYRQTGFTVSSLSSQFLEGDKLFWGAVPFHLGLMVVFFGHLLAFLLPSATLAWNSVPVRLITRAGGDQPNGHRDRAALAGPGGARMLGRTRISLGLLVVCG